jgi:hypothetical protein
MPESTTPTPGARVEILGPFRAFDATGREVQVPRGKNMALLAYLAAEPLGIERAQIEATLWPDSTERGQRQSLRQSLSTLRKLLGTDVFVLGDRVRLNGAVCTTDYADFVEALWENDGERCLALFRGTPLGDMPERVSVAFDDWVDRRQDAARQRLGAVAQSMGRRALEDGNEVEAQRVVRLGIRGGLLEDALHPAIYGTATDRSSWAAAALGTGGLETVVFRARPGIESLAVLVVDEDDGWTPSTLADLLSALPAEGRPCLVPIREHTEAPETEISTLLGLLTSLPGGAAVRQGTLDLVAHLASSPGAFDDPQGRASAEVAVADALDAALAEQALIFTLPAPRIRLQPTEILARALALHGGEGATLVVHGSSERELASLPVQTLTQACRHLRHVRQGSTLPLAPPPLAATLQPTSSYDAIEVGTDTAPPSEDAAPSPPATPPAVEVRARYRSEVRQRLTHLGYLATAAFAVGAAGLLFATAAPPEPLPDYDIVFCSTRTNAWQYFRWNGETRVVERISNDTASFGRSACGAGASADGATFWMATVRSGDGSGADRAQLMRYPNVDSRRDLVGQVEVSGLSNIRPYRADRDRFALMTTDTLGVATLLDPETGRRTPMPPSPIMIDGVVGPWLVGTMLEKPWGVARFNPTTQTLQRLTMSPIDELVPILRGDTVLFARGRQGDEEDGSLELMLLNIRTGEEEQLTENGWNDFEMDWSPLGHHICWSSEELGHYQADVWVMDLRTRRRWNLSDAPGREGACRFTPDGLAVLYAEFGAAGRDLLLKPVMGGDAIAVARYAGEDRFAGFLPRARVRDEGEGR